MDNNIIDAIKKDRVKMRSRSYFVLRTVFAVVAAVLVFLIIFFVTTFMIFALELNGGLYAVGFGPSGWLIFLNSLPWSMLLLSLVLTLILWILLRRYAIVYQQPFLYVLLILVVVMSLACFFLSAGAIHSGIYRYMSQAPIPFVSGVYQAETAPMNGVYRGQIIVLATSSFIVENDFGRTSTVFMLPATVSELTGIAPGDYVLIFGQGIATATIQAAGVEEIPDYR